MRIALLASTFLPRIGGAEIVVHNLAKQLSMHGHEVCVITWWGQWKEVWKRVPYSVIPLLPGSYSDRARFRWLHGKGSSRWISFQIRMLQKIVKFDLWNIHMAYPAGMLAVPELKRLGVPVVSTCHGDDIFYLPTHGLTLLENRYIREAVSRSLLFSDAVTAIRNSAREEYTKLGIANDRIWDIPNGTSVARIKAQPAERGYVREKMGWAPDAFVLLTVGRYHKVKGYDLIPDVLERLMARGGKFVWCVVGHGADEVQRMCEQAGFHGILDGVLPIVAESGDNAFDRFPPSELIRLYKAADVFVLPTYFESFGLVLIEAMAAGIPIVTTNVIGCRDAVTDGHNGLLVSPGDADGIASAIRQTMQDCELRDRLVQAGLKEAEQYEWDFVARKYIHCYEFTISRVRKM